MDAKILDLGVHAPTTIYARLANISAPNPNAEVVLVSQYNVFKFPDTEIDYQLGANIMDVSPPSGQTGTEVTISGNNLVGLGGLAITLEAIKLNGAMVTVLSSMQDTIVVRASSGCLGKGAIEIYSNQTANGILLQGPYSIIQNRWTQLEDGVISRIVPPAAQVGDTIYICGQELLGGGSSINSISIVGTNATVFSSSLLGTIYSDLPENCTNVTVPSPAGPLPLSGSIVITTDTQAIVASNSNTTFSYANITSVEPSKGQTMTRVTITGLNLLFGYDNNIVTPEVYVSGLLANLLTYTATQIVVQVAEPSLDLINTSGSVEIRASRFSIMFSLVASSSWTYLEAGSIDGIEPSSGQYGTRVNITGSNLLGHGSAIVSATFHGTVDGDFGNNPVVFALVISYSSTLVVLAVPKPSDASYTGPATITLVADNGAEVYGSGVMFKYLERGMISGITPSVGQGGTYGKTLTNLLYEMFHAFSLS